MSQTEFFEQRIRELETEIKSSWERLCAVQVKADELVSGPRAEWCRLNDELKTLRCAVELLTK